MSETLSTMVRDLTTVIEGGMVVDTDTGEVIFDCDSLDALQMRAADKFLATKCYAEEQRGKADRLRALASAMVESAKAFEKKADRVDAYMLRCAKEAGGEIATDSITVRVRKCPPSVQIIEEGKIPDDYWTEKVTRTPNKTLIKNTIKAGGSVDGACLVQNEKVEIR